MKKSKTTTEATAIHSSLSVVPESPTILAVMHKGKQIGKIGKSIKGFRLFNIEDGVRFRPTLESAVDAMVAALKIVLDDSTAADAPRQQVDRASENLASFYATVDRWAKDNDAPAVLVEAIKAILPTLKTRKALLKTVTDLEIAQGLLDFETDTLQRSRQLKHLRSKVGGLSRRSSSGETATEADVVATLLAGNRVTEAVKRTEKTLLVVLSDADGGTYEIELIVKSISAGDDDSDDDGDEA